MSLKDRVAALFAKTFGIDAKDFLPDISPEDVSNWDSIGHMNLVTHLESEFGVQFEVDEITEMSSGGKIIAMLQAKGVCD